MTTPAEIDEGMLNRARFAVKLSAAQSKIHNVPKDKLNEGQRFKYTSTESIFAMMRPVLVESGLAVLMTTRSMELIEATMAHVSLDIALIDTDTGYSETMTFDGFGKDGGDKAVPKAYTMAAKYWARIAFMIDLQDDAEKDEKPARQASPPRPAVVPTEQSTTTAPIATATNDLPASPSPFFDRINADRKQRNQAIYERPVIILEVLQGEGKRPDFRWEHLKDADTRAWAYRVAMAHVRTSEKQLA